MQHVERIERLVGRSQPAFRARKIATDRFSLVADRMPFGNIARDLRDAGAEVDERSILGSHRQMVRPVEYRERILKRSAIDRHRLRWQERIVGLIRPVDAKFFRPLQRRLISRNAEETENDVVLGESARRQILQQDVTPYGQRGRVIVSRAWMMQQEVMEHLDPVIHPAVILAKKILPAMLVPDLSLPHTLRQFGIVSSMPRLRQSVPLRRS